MTHSTLKLFHSITFSTIVTTTIDLPLFSVIASWTSVSLSTVCVCVQELLIEVYRCIGEPDSLYGCGGEKMSSPLTRWTNHRHRSTPPGPPPSERLTIEITCLLFFINLVLFQSSVSNV